MIKLSEEGMSKNEMGPQNAFSAKQPVKCEYKGKVLEGN